MKDKKVGFISVKLKRDFNLLKSGKFENKQLFEFI